jgi:hypothetical protein
MGISVKQVINLAHPFNILTRTFDILGDGMSASMDASGENQGVVLPEV